MLHDNARMLHEDGWHVRRLLHDNRLHKHGGMRVQGCCMITHDDWNNA